MRNIVHFLDDNHIILWYNLSEIGVIITRIHVEMNDIFFQIVQEVLL